jgi:hypothetical protein
MKEDKYTQEVIDQLAILEPTEADAPRAAAQALARLNQQMAAQEQGRLSYGIRRFFAMSKRKYATSFAMIVLLLIVAFSFPAVRAAASEFLGLFRVQKFAAISVSPEQIAILRQVAEEGLTPGNITIVEEPGAITPVDSVAEAQAITGLSSARTIPALGAPDTVYVADGGVANMTIDVDGSRAIAEAVGIDPALIPDSVDGALVDATVFAGIGQEWNGGTILLQTESPLVDYPDELDPTVLGEALLQVLGLNAEEAQRLAQEIDWTTTLLLPVPTEVATFSEVSVDGVSGIALASLDGANNALLWQKNGIVYLLTGSGELSELISLANGLQ